MNSRNSKKNPLDVEALRAELEIDPTLPSGLRWKPHKKFISHPDRMAGTIKADTGHWKVCVNYKQMLVHRVIMVMHTGVDRPDMEIDHINGDRADNRVENLRWATRTQNVRNRHVARSNTGFKGVHFYEKRGFYAAYYKIANKLKWAGRSKCPYIAASMRDWAVYFAYGEFANLNGDVIVLP